MQAFSRDDMVLRPRVRGRMSRPREQAHVERQAERASKHGSKIGRILRMRAKAKAVGLGRRVAAGLGKPQVAEAGSTMRTLGRARFLNPVSLGIAAVAVAALVTTRLATGRSFENIGENLKTTILGDAGPETEAARRARELMEGNEDVTRMIGMGHTAVRDQSLAASKILRSVYGVEEEGRQAIRNDPSFQVNGTLDMLILRLAEMIREAWANGDAKAAWRMVMDKIGFFVTGVQVLSKFWIFR